MKSKLIFQNQTEARAAFRAHSALAAQKGIIFPNAQSYVSEDMRHDIQIAMDSIAMDATSNQATLTTDPNSSVPALLTTFIDPAVFEILFAPNKAVEIFGENRKGTWLDDVAMFPVVEHNGSPTEPLIF